jgi:CRISPR-associated protein Cmr6
MRRNVLQTITFQRDRAPHAGLWLEKFLNGESDQAKSELVGNVADLSASPLHARFVSTWQHHLNQLAVHVQDSEPVTEMFKTSGRTIVGLGGAGVLETSITLHRTYGVPYIPGSALKGLASSYAHRKLNNASWNKAKNGTSQGQDHATLFGNTESAGFVTFLDALPINYTIHRDVLTPHHSDYNGGGNVPPADWDNPIPVPFLSCSGTFLVAFVAPREWKDAVLEILKLALAEDGIGAKTSSGYGRLELTDQVPPPPNPISATDQQAEKIRADMKIPEYMFTQAPRGLAKRLLACDCSPDLKRTIAQEMLELLSTANPEQWAAQDWYQELHGLVNP